MVYTNLGGKALLIWEEGRNMTDAVIDKAAVVVFSPYPEWNDPCAIEESHQEFREDEDYGPTWTFDQFLDYLGTINQAHYTMRRLVGTTLVPKGDPA